MTNRMRGPFITCLLVVAPGAYTTGGCARGSAEQESAGQEAAGQEPAEQHEDGDEHNESESPVVTLDSTAMSMADIRVGTAAVVEANRLPVTGTITYDENRVSHIGPRTEGRIVALRADLGSRVERGQLLAVLESPEVGATRAELHEAEALLRIQTENHAREQRLEAQGISSRKELLDAEAELRRAEAAMQSATERLRTLGAGHGDGGQFTIVAPFDGVVVEKHATLGEVADPSDQLFTVADLGNLWIELDIFERDLERVSTGQPVVVSTAAYPDRTFPGQIVYVADVLDPERRTVRARVEVENPERSLKPGMFATAEIEIGNGEPVVVVPREAVQDVEGRSIVWVPGDAPGQFRAQPVDAGAAMEDGRMRILSGLAAGEPVVVAGAFTLKAELSKGEFGGHGH
ncbi:MAG: efflux RND transporter periplasmic adaptor subunit [Longimicrobiales bacterium]